MNRMIMMIMACGAVLGGLDRLCGNRLGYGKRFEEGFHYLGPTALSMVGIICLAPLISGTLGRVVVPLYCFLGVDPAMFGSLLAIDMGGYQLAMELASDPAIGRYAGIIAASVFGCTLVFTIPVGMELVEKEQKPVFARGIMLGLAAMPAALLAGGLACGLDAWTVLHENLPVFAISFFLAVGLWKIPERMVNGFGIFAWLVKAVITVGLTLGAVTYMTGWTVLPGMAPIEEAMAVVSSIGIVLLGSLPVTELLQRLLKTPCTALGKMVGLDSAGVLGLLVSIVSPIPTIVMLKDMNEKSRLVNVACMVSTASMLAAHLGFTVSTEPDMLPALLLAKVCGGAAAVGIGLAADAGIAKRQSGSW